ncbi:MAG: hypothetical protein A3C07_04005 [Candidatus Sungbacteria bacterium RIFCSPHIGHO2_02_FULL_47_11]|uniref:Peptidase M10 metallopeptidase domain-containing protein n=1 Tax=Candidatus Sungbacteria bacterium RIFCSPHIGHO2_02_FULL_47_11 TaxID=1802270 RepID=A0A1G2KJF2_9BACT|nr:MAG: hypothetical protein A3C07_04005 [Candidatus Sungbacteria bacterium RIFCSPHIGHO2_02_FULL_47_11]
MLKTKFRRNATIVALVLSAVGAAAFTNATHSWGNYHWARKANPFTLKLGDNVSSAWDAYLAAASTDWTKSIALDTTVVAGGTDSKRCRATTGRVEVCNRAYGNTGWLGVAQIWISGNHITKGTAKVNDTYFNLATYNTSAWRGLVMCQEIAHTFGLDHQDENFSNLNLGTCMDYTSDPDGPPSNEHPNAHDYEQLETIYSHLDTITTVGQTVARRGNHDDADGVAEFGKALRKDGKGKTSLYVRDLGKGEKVLTFVFWTE